MTLSAAYQPATLTPDYGAILDSSGQVVSFDDPRVVHVWPIPMGPHLGSLLRCVYERAGLRFRGYDSVDLAALQEGRSICSGRECLPVNAIAGLTHRDLAQARPPGEVTLYYCPNQRGPCQNGAWPVLFDIFVERERVRNAVFMVWLTPRNNFFGRGPALGRDYITAITLADLLDEVASAIRATAADPREALASLRESVDALLTAARQRRAPLEKLLGPLVGRLAGIARRSALAEVPKILIFGGLNLIFVHRPLQQLLEQQRVAVRSLGIAEGSAWIVSEPMVRHGARVGRLRASKQYGAAPHLVTLAKQKVRKLVGLGGPCGEIQRGELRAGYGWLGVRAYDNAERHLRRIMRPTGFLFDVAIPFSEIVTTGDPIVSNNTFTETTTTIGRYRCAARSGVFDGLLSVGAFNCQPAQNAVAAIRAIAEEHHVPFAAIDCDGSEPSASQVRVLENLVVQARRHHSRR